MNFSNSRPTISKVPPRDIPKNSQKFPAVVPKESTGLVLGDQVSLLPTNSRWSPTLNRVLEEPPATFPQYLTLGAIVFCLTCGAWAWFGKIDEVSKAQGKLIPQGETYKIESVELGKVKYIAVKEGEAVQAGQTLIELDTDLAEQEIMRLEQKIQAYQTELSQKKLLREKLILEATTRENITQAEVAAKKSALFIAKRKALTLRHLLNQQQLEVQAHLTKQVNLKSLSTLGQEHSRQLKGEKISHQERLERLLPLAQQGAISQEYIFQAEQSLREVERLITQSQVQEIANIREQIFQSNQVRRELDARITHNQGELASALIEFEILEAELIQIQAEGKRIQLETEQKIQQLEFELTQIENEIADTKNVLSAAQAKLQQKVLKAPIDGIVLSLNIDHSGKVVQAGETIIEIAPKDAPLVVSAFLPNKEAGLIKEGMPVQVKLDAYPYQSYGLIPGTLNSISADAKLNPQLGEVYQVEVALEKDYVTDNQRQINFKAGQTATADIVIRRRRILDVWLEPIKKLQQDGIEM